MEKKISVNGLTDREIKQATNNIVNLDVLISRANSEQRKFIRKHADLLVKHLEEK